MLKKNLMEYSAFVYQQNDMFIADCSSLNFVACGSNEMEAVEELTKSIKDTLNMSDILVKPIYERR